MNETGHLCGLTRCGSTPRPKNASKVLPLCDTAILTGSSIANGTIEDLLGYTRPGATVIVTGPTASLLPDALFARNATIVSGVKVTDQDLALDMLAEAWGHISCSIRA